MRFEFARGKRAFCQKRSIRNPKSSTLGVVSVKFWPQAPIRGFDGGLQHATLS